MNYDNEQAELADLALAAAEELKEAGEPLVVWAGGDAPNQQNWLVKQFRTRFPEVPLRLKVDLSKYHDIKVYQELLDGALTPDVVMLQTSHDFEAWRDMGALEPFTPQSFPSLVPGYGDPDGAFLPAYLTCFLPQYARSVSAAPSSYHDFLRPEFRHRLVLTPPHDDDAVLFVYDHIFQEYGRRFLEKLAEQKPHFLRGTAAPAALVGHRKYLGNLTGYLTPPNQPAISFVPERDFFISWPQRAALFRLTRHKAAARLFLAYLTSYEYQSLQNAWSVRTDVDPPTGLRPLGDYPNTNPLEFIDWMRDREHLHELRQMMMAIFGPVYGQSPLTDPALLKIYQQTKL